MLEGELTMRLGDDEVSAGPGAFVSRAETTSKAALPTLLGGHLLGRATSSTSFLGARTQ